MGGQIVTITDTRGITSAEELRAWLGRLGSMRTRLFAQGLREVPPVLVDATAPPAAAAVNHGLWIVRCPETACRGATQTAPGLPFMCPNCLNGGIGHRWRLVEFPAEREAIEAALGRQPVLELRNWEPGVSAAALAAAVDAELAGERPVHVRTLRDAR